MDGNYNVCPAYQFCSLLDEGSKRAFYDLKQMNIEEEARLIEVLKTEPISEWRRKEIEQQLHDYQTKGWKLVG